MPIGDAKAQRAKTAIKKMGSVPLLIYCYAVPRLIKKE